MTGRTGSLTQNLIKSRKNNFFMMLIEENKASLPQMHTVTRIKPLTSTARKHIKASLELSQRLVILSTTPGMCMPPCAVATQEPTQGDYNLYIRERAKFFTSMENPLPELRSLCGQEEILALHHTINIVPSVSFIYPTRQSRHRMEGGLDLLVPN